MKSIAKERTFFVAGISYRSSSIDTRERFSLGDKDIAAVYGRIAPAQDEGALVLSTCNRTEIYGFCDSPEQMAVHLVECSSGDMETFREEGYILGGDDAIRHMFRMAVGLESQIPGDFEIISQVKDAYRKAKKLGAGGAFMERLTNTLINTSKKIKSQTAFSTGATSTAYAAVHYLRHNVPHIESKNILLYGTGKIGRVTCENLVKHIPAEQVKLVNRTYEKAAELAERVGSHKGPFEGLPEDLAKADIVIVATGAPSYTITTEMVDNYCPEVFIDLSVPRNVDPSLAESHPCRIVDVDHLSGITRLTRQKRKAEIPEVEKLLEEGMKEFKEWLESRKFVPVMTAVHEKLKVIQQREINSYKKKNSQADQEHLEEVSDQILRKITNQFFRHLKSEGDSREDSILLLEKMFDVDSAGSTGAREQGGSEAGPSAGRAGIEGPDIHRQEAREQGGS